MTKIKSFSYNEKTLKKLYNSKIEKGDLLGAISTLKTLQGIKNDSFVYLEKGLCYYKMGLYEDALDSFFHALAIIKEVDEARCYAYIGVSYFRLNNISLASHYIQKFMQLNVKITDSIIFDAITEFVDTVTNDEDKFYLVYPYEKADFTKLLDECDELFKIGNLEEVIEKLTIIPEKSKYYFDALLKISVCKFLLKDEKGAILDIEKALTLEEDNVFAISNAISMYLEGGNKKRVKELLETLESLEITDDEELYKVTMVYCELDMPILANRYAEKYYQNNKYDKHFLHIYGIINYNLERFDLAYECFRKIFLLTGSFTSSTYLAICENAINNGEEREYKTLNYIFDIPKRFREVAIKKLNDIMHDKTFVLDENNKSETLALIDYCFECDNYKMQASALTLLSHFIGDITTSYLLNLLISYSVFDRVKQGIIGHLLDSTTKREIPAQMGGIFRKIKLYRPKFMLEEHSVFTSAYIYAYCTLAPFEKSLKKLSEKSQELYEIAVNKGVVSQIEDSTALGAFMYEYSGIRKIEKRREFAKFFNANLTKIKKIKSLILDE